MFTSFAPSPIDSVVFVGYLCHIISTISAFYFGDVQQANITFILAHISINLSSRSYQEVILYNDSPEIIIACCSFLNIKWLASAT